MGMKRLVIGGRPGTKMHTKFGARGMAMFVRQRKI